MCRNLDAQVLENDDTSEGINDNDIRSDNDSSSDDDLDDAAFYCDTIIQ